MKNIFLGWIAIGLLSGCGTMSSTYPIVRYDPLLQKNECATMLSIVHLDHMIKGDPSNVYITIYQDNKIKLSSHHYGIFDTDQSYNIKDLAVRVDNNAILKFKDNDSKDILFESLGTGKLKEQLIEGDNLVIRLNYYDGYSNTLTTEISDFREDWSEMLVKCNG